MCLKSATRVDVKCSHLQKIEKKIRQLYEVKYILISLFVTIVLRSRQISKHQVCTLAYMQMLLYLNEAERTKWKAGWCVFVRYWSYEKVKETVLSSNLEKLRVHAVLLQSPDELRGWGRDVF